VSARRKLRLFGDPLYPGNGYPPRPGEDRPGLSPFGRLVMGQNPGTSSRLIYDHALCEPQLAPTDMIQIEGDDVDACQLVVTLHPPRVIPLPFHEVQARLDKQNLTGEQSNSEVTDCHFPGTKRPIRWPPLEALIEFGVGGVNTTVYADYINGLSFGVTASYLRVRALISQSRRDGDIFGTSAAYYTAAHCGPGFAEGHVQRTVFVGDVDNNEESDVFDVPKFGKVAFISGCRTRHHDEDEHHHDRHRRPVVASGWVRFFQSPDGENPVGDFFVTNYLQRVEVPNGGLYFSFFNEAGHRMKMSVIFEIAL
jgi:hypothetical protein